MIDKNKRALLVMAGGKGTRLWPESTSKTPKQYLKLIDNESLLTQTLKRFEELVGIDNRYIITTEDQKQLAKEHSRGMVNESKGLVFEPHGRNTAPCILLGLSYLAAQGMDLSSVVAIVPSDHVILNSNGHQESMRRAFEFAEKTQSIITLGIPPHFPHTGYGYIEKGNVLDDGFFQVKAFKEKPELNTAKEYLKSGNYFWNAGMFVSSIKTLIDEMTLHSPDLASFFEDFKKLFQSSASESEISDLYQKLEKISIDYAVMEKSSNIKVLAADFDWNDLGSWDAMEAVVSARDENTILACKKNYLIESKGNIIFSPQKVVALRGIEDMIIVCNEDVLMLTPKKDAQKVSQFVDLIKKQTPESDLV